MNALCRFKAGVIRFSEKVGGSVQSGGSGAWERKFRKTGCRAGSAQGIRAKCAAICAGRLLRPVPECAEIWSILSMAFCASLLRPVAECAAAWTTIALRWVAALLTAAQIFAHFLRLAAHSICIALSECYNGCSEPQEGIRFGCYPVFSPCCFSNNPATGLTS